MEDHSGNLTINGGTFKGLNNHCLVIQGNGASLISGANLMVNSDSGTAIYNDKNESSRNANDY